MTCRSCRGHYGQSIRRSVGIFRRSANQCGLTYVGRARRSMTAIRDEANTSGAECAELIRSSDMKRVTYDRNACGWIFARRGGVDEEILFDASNVFFHTAFHGFPDVQLQYLRPERSLFGTAHKYTFK